MDLNTDFINYMNNEELDGLISQIKEVQRSRAESRKIDLWKKVNQAVQNYIMECGMIELLTEDYNATLDADSFSIPGKINLLD